MPPAADAGCRRLGIAVFTKKVDAWKEVPSTDSAQYGTTINAFNTAEVHKSVTSKSSGVRIEVKLREGHSGGILWRGRSSSSWSQIFLTMTGNRQGFSRS